jgi:hypothetical protein
MKRGLAALAFAAPLAIIPGTALATTSGGSTSGGDSVTIQQYADYDAAGFVLDVGLYVRCSGGVNGVVNVNVNQYPPQTAYPVAFGSGPQTVVCDGNTHAVGVTIAGEGFDAGTAKATATLTNPTTLKSKSAAKWITIVVV